MTKPPKKPPAKKGKKTPPKPKPNTVTKPTTTVPGKKPGPSTTVTKPVANKPGVNKGPTTTSGVTLDKDDKPTIGESRNKGQPTGELDRPQKIERLDDAFLQLRERPYAPLVVEHDVSFDLPNTVFVGRPSGLPQSVADAKDSFDSLKRDIPVLLFPVRLETRYTSDLKKLRIRIFPDQASVDSLDPRLTQEEYDAGQEFLSKHNKDKTRDDKLETWRSFATSYEPRRAAHIARSIRAGGAQNNLRDPNESHRAIAPLLPDCWCVTGYAKGKVVFDKASAKIPEDLAFSPDLAADVTTTGDLAIDPAIRWMTNYNEALQKGMAVTVNIPAWARDEIEELYVVGIRTADPVAKTGKLTPAKAAKKLGSLIESHLLDWGAGFVSPGTATNNTSDVEAGWTANEVDIDDLYTRLIEQPLVPQSIAMSNPNVEAAPDERMAPVGALDGAGTAADMNYHRLETMLGLPENSILKQIENRTGSEDAVQAAMNTLLWPVTLGEMFSQVMQGRETQPMPKDATDWLRDWFIGSVRGGAAMPTLRLGRTPYGVLPVQKTHLANNPSGLSGEAITREVLGSRLRDLLRLWEEAADDVLRMGEISGEIADQFPDPGDRFLQILRQQPHPAKYILTQALSERALFDLRYEIHNLVVHPDSPATLIPDIFEDATINVNEVPVTGVPPGKDAYFDWPESFNNGRHQLRVLREKKQILTDLLDENSDLYQPQTVDFGIATYDISGAVALVMGTRSPLINQAIDWLQEMIEICQEYQENNAAMDAAFNPPNDVYSGAIGFSSEDTHLSYLSFEGRAKTWKTDQHVVVKRGTAPVGFARQVDYLLGYATSFVSANAAPAEPTFPGGKKPLLYRLLKEAIYRTGVDEEASSLALFEISEVATNTGVSQVDRDQEIGKILGGMDAGKVNDLTSGLTTISGAAPGARVSSKNDPLARTLRGTTPAALNTMALSVDREITRKRNDPEFPKAEMEALSGQLKLLGRNGGAALSQVRMAPVPSPRRTKINEMKAALSLLRDLNADQIELLMSQTLGLASWRIDAWLTSLPVKRIEELRAGSKRNGVQIGAYGWVHNLRPNNRDKSDGNRVTSQGFIHTPSLTHAKTAAVLRSGWTNYGSRADDSPMAVDLRSERMRDAQWIYAAVRRGQDLGDVLGYRFERFLKTKVAGAHWIYPIRQAVLSMTGERIDPTQPCVDGLELNRITTTGQQSTLQSEATQVLQRLGGASKTNTWALVQQALDYLEAQTDALADAAIADSTHALVQGNLMRAGSSLSAISDGATPPPELDFLQISPPAKTLTHRVALITPPAKDGAALAWVSGNADYPAAAADKDAEALAAGLLGGPEQLNVNVQYVDADGAAVGTHSFTWKDMIAAGSPFAGSAVQMMMNLPAEGLTDDSDLGRRLLAHAAAFPPGGVPAGASPELAMSDTHKESQNRLLDRWRAWRSVFLDARPLAPRDIVMSDTGNEAQIALADLETRATTAVSKFTQPAQAILDALPEPQEGNETPIGTMNAATLLGHMDKLARLGVNHAVYRSATGTIDDAEIWARAWSLAPTLRKTKAALTAIPEPSDTSVDERLSAARKRLKAIFGAKFHGITALQSPDLPLLAQSFGRWRQRQQMGTAGRPAHWVEKQGYVRPAIRAFNDAMLIQDCDLEAPDGPRLQVAQWPEAETQPWIATNGVSGDAPPDTSMVASTVGGKDIQIAGTISGLVIDEVVDRLPSTTVNTGAAVHFDAPNTEAPQSFLLALPPEGSGWDYATMIDTVRDTFHLARARAVDGPLMSDMHQVLPSIFASQGTITGAGNG